MAVSSPPPTIGIDFGGTSVKIGVCQGPTILGNLEPIITADHAGPDALIAAMAAGVAKLRQQHPEVNAVGVGVPGLVNFETGLVHEVTNVPGWVRVPLSQKLSAATGLPVLVENDANAMTYAEYRYGAAQGFKDVIGLTLGTGVGGGLVLNGQMHRGRDDAAGEIGQMSVHYAGKAGPYGNWGALERYIGHRQIAQMAAEHYAAAGITKELDECSPRHLSAAAAAGDAVALACWQEVATYLGTALASIIWLLNPQAFVIGGGVARAGEVLFEPLRERVRSMVSPVIWAGLQILPAQFCNDAGIIGNAALAADSVKA
jgi:glucokinase